MSDTVLNRKPAHRESHPSEFPWSSYHYNAQGQANELLTPHREYCRLGKTDQERQAAYRQLFKHHLAEQDMIKIRDATNKAWVLGSDRFKARMERQLERRVQPTARGGDRKSQEFRARNAKIEGV